MAARGSIELARDSIANPELATAVERRDADLDQDARRRHDIRPKTHRARELDQDRRFVAAARDLDVFDELAGGERAASGEQRKQSRANEGRARHRGLHSPLAGADAVLGARLMARARAIAQL